MTNLQIAKLYLATNTTATATQIDTAVTSGAALTAINALTAAAFLEASYQAEFHRSVDADGTAAYLAKLTDGTLTKDGFVAILKAGADIYPTTGAFVALNTADKTTIVNKDTAAAAADTLTVGASAVQLATVTDVASTATVAVEAINNAEYTAALTAYNTAVTTAAASKAAADAAALTVSSVALATASQTAAATAKTDADTVVAKSALLVTAATATVSAADDITSAATTTTAAAAQQTAAGLVTTATTAVATATQAAADAAAVGTTFALTTSTDVIFGTSKSDTVTATAGLTADTSKTLGSNDTIADSSSVDNDTMTITATDDVTSTATIIGIENVNFNLDAASTTAGTTWGIKADNIAAGTLTATVTKAATTVNAVSVTALKDNMIVSTNLAAATLAGIADADLTLKMTKATGAATVTNVTGTTNDLTITSSTTGLLTIADAAAENNIVVNAQGAVTVTTLTAATDTLSTLAINAKGAITLTDTTNAGNITLSTTTGNIAVTTTSRTAIAGEENLSATTAAGDVTINSAVNIDGTVTVSATGDASAAVTGADGDIAIIAADHAVAAVLTATGGIAITSMLANKALTMTYGQASTIGTAAADLVTSLTIKSNNAAATAADAKVTATTGGTLVIVDNIYFTGSNNATLAIDGDDLVTAAASTAGGTTAAAVIATDNSTATSRIELQTATGANLDLSKLAVDQIAMTADQTSAANVLTFASGANFHVASNQTALGLSAAAVAGNTLNIVVEDDSTAVDATAYTLTALTTTNIATVNLALNDSEAAVVATGTYNVGTANTLKVTGAGALTIGTSVIANTFDASAATGVMTIEMLNTAAATIVKTGSGNDVFHITNNTAANYNIDGGTGVDTIITDTAGALDLSASTLTLTSIEKIDITAAGASVTLSGAQATGHDYVVIGDAAADVLAVLGTNATGEVINISSFATSIASLTLTGLGGGDTLTGSATSGTIISGAGGADTIVAGTGADFLYGGAANDSITTSGGIDAVAGGAGADTINLTEVASVADYVTYLALTEGSAAGAAAGTFSAYDVVTGFTTGTDKIVFDGAAAITASVVVTTPIAGAKYVVAGTAATAASSDLVAAASFLDVDKVVTFLNDTGAIANATDVGGLGSVVGITFGTSTYVYSVSTADAAVIASEVTLLGTVDAVLVAGDLVIA